MDFPPLHPQHVRLPISLRDAGISPQVGPDEGVTMQPLAPPVISRNYKLSRCGSRANVVRLGQWVQYLPYHSLPPPRECSTKFLEEELRGRLYRDAGVEIDTHLLYSSRSSAKASGVPRAQSRPRDALSFPRHLRMRFYRVDVFVMYVVRMISRRSSSSPFSISLSSSVHSMEGPSDTTKVADPRPQLHVPLPGQRPKTLSWMALGCRLTPSRRDSDFPFIP
ncbi:hypothetical protein BHE74_00009357 [Ensete ventricosum]|nr:hypothetical protein GW17_00050075 [Ensete ventricosum]RWW82198.1 hypothetical protein BHE74_00009357 [Ensete ventricosum]RZR88103.1 hypothetical protein BHM03_00015617 [Ensete ventricosum]